MARYAVTQLEQIEEIDDGRTRFGQCGITSG